MASRHSLSLQSSSVLVFELVHAPVAPFIALSRFLIPASPSSDTGTFLRRTYRNRTHCVAQATFRALFQTFDHF